MVMVILARQARQDHEETCSIAIEPRAAGRNMKIFPIMLHSATSVPLFSAAHHMRRGVVLPIEAASRSTFCFWATGDLGLKGKVGGVRTESRILAFCIAFWVTFQ